MNKIQEVNIQDFDYDLPDHRIARYPLKKRSDSQLLHFSNGNISDKKFKEIIHLFESTDLWVVNNTKVIPARLHFSKSTGAQIEIFCLEPMNMDYSQALASIDRCSWKCFVGGAKKWKEGSLQIKYENNYTLTATKQEQLTDSYIVKFEWDNEAQSFAEVLEMAGNIPLPPYFNRDAEDTDKERYQTVYAVAEGSVAAPTAGLHFTPRLFEKLAAKNIEKEFVTLHVGAGTFKPVKAARMEEHEMHAEYIDVRTSLIEKLRD